MTPPTETDLLLAHGSWIRSLARRMVADEHRAEDLVQETWLAALRRPAALRSPRRWLRTVLTNLVRRDLRDTGRRNQREQANARAEAEPSVVATLEAASLGRELADAVLELDEPFRGCVLLRYYEDLPPREIAERLGVPVRTVNSRLSRGLERLRETWRRRHGDQGPTWTQSLLLLARPPGAAAPVAAAPAAPASSIPLGALLMNAKLVTAAAVLVGGGTLAWVATSLPDREAAAVEPASRAAVPVSSNPADVTPPEDLAAALPGSVERQVVERSDPGPESLDGSPPLQTLVEQRLLRGRVLDVDATPLAGVEVEFRPRDREREAIRAVSGSGGVFEMHTERLKGDVRPTAEDLVVVSRGVVQPTTSVDPLVIVAPMRHLAGRVVDELGTPLSGVEVSLELGEDFLGRFDAVLDSTEMTRWAWRTDAEGAFVLERTPVVREANLRAVLDGYLTTVEPAPVGAHDDLVLVLRRPELDGSMLTGVVVDPGGRAVAGAHVSLGGTTAVTDGRGGFQIPREHEGEGGHEITAIHAGHLPARLRAGDDGRGNPVWPDSIVLALGAEPLTLAGRVVDEAGVPRKDASLWIDDPTWFGTLGEDYGAYVEYSLSSEDGAQGGSWDSAFADDDGRFEIRGLLDREYMVTAFDHETLERAQFGPFRAGDRDLEIVFARQELGHVAGRVVSRDGTPLEGVNVRLLKHTFGGQWDNPDSGDRTTDAEGRFDYGLIGGEGLQLWIKGDDIVPELIPIPSALHAGDLEIVLRVRCHFKVDLGIDAHRADAIRVHDADGNKLDLLTISPTGMYIRTSVDLVDGRTPNLGVEDSATTLVLWKDGQEAQRIPLHLVPGQLNVIRP